MQSFRIKKLQVVLPIGASLLILWTTVNNDCHDRSTSEKRYMINSQDIQSNHRGLLLAVSTTWESEKTSKVRKLYLKIIQGPKIQSFLILLYPKYGFLIFSSRFRQFDQFHFTFLSNFQSLSSSWIIHRWVRNSLTIFGCSEELVSTDFRSDPSLFLVVGNNTKEREKEKSASVQKLTGAVEE